MIAKWLRHELSNKYPGIEFDVLIPPDDKMGDYSTNLAFALAKKEKKSPMDVAERLAGEFANPDFFEKVEPAKPGFVNFYLKKEFLQRELGRIHGHLGHYGKSEAGSGKTVIVEYSAPNIAKPMHVGHLRSTIIGDSLAGVYEMLGYRVIRWNYIGDWGTQFGKLIAAYKKWTSEYDDADPIGSMLKLYVKFHEEMAKHPELEESGREEFQKLENGDKENRELWQKFREESLEEFNRMYRELGVRFDVTKGESAYEQEMQAVVFELGMKKLAVDSPEGGVIVPLDKYNLPPALIRKTDGASLYITRDLASLKNRISEFAPEKILYVVANQQTLHLAQLFAVAKELELPTQAVHVKYGLVLGEDGKKFSTREGNAVPLQEVIDKIVKLAAETVKQKNPELPEEKVGEISHAVGVGALKYNDLKQHPHSDIVFDWKAMLDLSGNSGPYLQYTYARLVSILAKAGTTEVQLPVASYQLLASSEERALMRHLLDFGDVVEKCAEHYALSGLALYLYELANGANRFYEAHRILDDENNERKGARLILIRTVSEVLNRGLGLLGIRSLERI